MHGFKGRKKNMFNSKETRVARALFYVHIERWSERNWSSSRQMCLLVLIMQNDSRVLSAAFATATTTFSSSLRSARSAAGTVDLGDATRARVHYSWAHDDVDDDVKFAVVCCVGPSEVGKTKSEWSWKWKPVEVENCCYIIGFTCKYFECLTEAEVDLIAKSSNRVIKEMQDAIFFIGDSGSESAICNSPHTQNHATDQQVQEVIAN